MDPLFEHDIEVARQATPAEKLRQALELMAAGLRLKRDVLRSAGRRRRRANGKPLSNDGCAPMTEDANELERALSSRGFARDRDLQHELTTSMQAG